MRLPAPALTAPAGETRREVIHTVEPLTVGDRWCFRLAFFGGPDQTGAAVICHAIDDVQPPTWPNLPQRSVQLRGPDPSLGP